MFVHFRTLMISYMAFFFLFFVVVFFVFLFFCFYLAFVVSHISFFCCLGKKTVLRDCGICWVSTNVFFINHISNHETPSFKRFPSIKYKFKRFCLYLINKS